MASNTTGPLWREVVVEALEAIGGSGHLEEIYTSVKKLSPRSLPRTWEAIVRRELEYNSSSSRSFRNRHDLFVSVGGIGSGVWALRRRMVALDLPAPAERMSVTVTRLIRDSALIRRLKRLYENQCQICLHTLSGINGETYSEGHHIRPLGRPHNGPDVAENILILCPNCHARCDLGFEVLNYADLRICSGHEVGHDHIEYNNTILIDQAV